MIKNSKKILNNKNRNKQATKKKINKSWPDEAIRKTRWGGRHPNQLWKRPSSQALAANQWAARLHFRGTNRKSTFYLLAKSRISSMITEISQGGTFSELLYSTKRLIIHNYSAKPELSKHSSNDSQPRARAKRTITKEEQILLIRQGGNRPRRRNGAKLGLIFLQPIHIQGRDLS